MNVSFLFSLPSGLAEYDGVKKLLADAAAFPVEEGAGGAVDVPNLFCGCDPEGQPLGSGGGTVHLLHESYTEEQRRPPAAGRQSFLSWLRLNDSEGRVIVHAGGLSRRLPAYAALGKALLPLPPCRWHRGSQMTRALLSTQVPLYRALITSAPSNLRTLVACGDICVYVKGTVPSLAQFTDTDVLCIGVRTDAQLLQNHGVFFMSRQKPFDLEFMLQKPSVAEVRRCATEGNRSYLLDTGMWVLSERAVEVLARKCLGAALDDGSANGEGLDGHRHSVVHHPYDLYSEFGAALGSNCLRTDPEVTSLKASVLEIPDAEFLHYGTNREVIASTRALQVCESPTPSWSWSAPFDGILVRERSDDGPSQADLTEAEAASTSTTTNTTETNLDFTAGDALPLLATPSSVIVHSAVVLAPLDGSAAVATAPAGTPKRPVKHLWVESSWIGARWTLHGGHLLTGIPKNNWKLDLPTGTCVNVVPVARGKVQDGAAEGATPYAARPYHIDDVFRGDVRDESTLFMGVGLSEWLASRGLAVDDVYPAHADASKPLDIYEAALFPVCATVDQLGDFLYMATLPVSVSRDTSAVDAARLVAGQAVWRRQPRVSAMDLLRLTDVPALLRNSENYERRMLTLTMALVTSDSKEISNKLGWAPTMTPTLGTQKAVPSNGFAVHSSVLSSPMVNLLQQQFFLLDLDGVARRMVELGVGLPMRTGATEPRQTAGLRGKNGTTVEGDSADESIRESDSNNSENDPFAWAHIFLNEGGIGGAAIKAPVCSVSPHLVASHYHMFVRRVVELQLEAVATAVSEEERAKRLALLHVSSVKEAEELAERHDAAAFEELHNAIMDSYPNERHTPKLGVQLDQIIWGRAPLRIDLSGGWTDTPPYTLLNGGGVINVAVELNGQPPVQVYVRVRTDDPTIVVHSIDSGARTTLNSYDDIRTYAAIQNPFSIPKAALALCGFLPEFCTTEYASLQDQLKADFGGHGLEISLLVAVPTGSGLGTSSIVAGVVLRSLAEFCQLRWDEHIVCRRVLLIEQMLTAGGGWQDQYGGLFEGLKLVQSAPGLPATPTVRWMPSGIFTDSRFASLHLLYYTGITRMAKGILAEVVRKVFLNNRAILQLLQEVGGPHMAAMYDRITMLDYKGYARLVNRTWEQKKLLDDGVCNPQVQAIVDMVEPYVWGLLLPGAGGGGYLYMCAKDEACARKIRELLTQNPPNPYARFVDMTVSTTGVQVSRS